MSGDRTARVGYGAALASSEFRALFGAQFVSLAGSSVAAVTLTVLIFRRTGSPLLASLSFALAFLPYLLGGGLLSGLVDRVRPRLLVSGCDFLSALLGAAMAWPRLPVGALLALLFGIGTLSSLASGARAALVRSTVSEEAYVPGRSLLRIAGQLAQLGGNAAGGVLLVLLGTSGALLVNAGSFAFSAAAVRLVVADHPIVAAAGRARLLRDSLRGARAILGLRELRRLLLAGWLAPMFTVAPEALAAPYVAAHHGSARLVGWWLVALPVGLIAGDVAGVRLLGPARQNLLVAPAAAAGFLPYLAFALDPPVPVAMGLLAVAGVCGFYFLGLDRRVRDAAPPELFARTMTLNSAGVMTLQGLGFALAGAIAQATGPAAAVALAGAAGLSSILLLLRADLRPGAPEFR
ncbi:MAG TPA: MFS transporter [Gaiellaceae bacterium]|nr:MFS transporter [Gaiellaceae bacterium]